MSLNALNPKFLNSSFKELLLAFFLLSWTCKVAAVDTVNTGLAATWLETSPLGFASFVVRESSQNGEDLNDDGDTDGLDNVLHIYDAVNDEIINLGYAVIDSNTEFSGQWLVFQVFEMRQGFTDFNNDGDTNDGDTNDAVLFHYNLLTGEITNTELPGSPIGISPNNEIHFVMRENAGPWGDLNGDGDSNDNIAHVYDINTGTVTSLGLSSNGWASYGNGFAVLSREVDQGNTDLNGDGDTLDYILHMYDSRDGSITNTMRAAFPDQRVQDYVMAVSEASDGVDWNGDGDVSDTVLQIYDLDTRTFTNLGRSYTLHLVNVGVNGDHMVWVARESAEGNTDLNGDGDTSDEIVFVYDHSTGVIVNLGLAGERNALHAGNGFATFLVNEGAQRQDLNNDGDSSDKVAYIYDFATGTVTNTEIGVFQTGQIRAHGDYAVIHYSEWRNGSTDLNGDGDASDFLMHVYNHKNGIIDYLGEDGFFAGVEGDNLLMSFYEFRTGIDYNEDGDTGDSVAHIVDGNTLAVTNLFASGSPIPLGPLVLTLASEYGSNEDLNGDGDLNDIVLFIIDPFAQPVATIPDLVEFVQSLGLQNGVENALLAKLDAAQSALENGNVHTAVNNLEAFINQVEAQSGKKLSTEHADELIEVALNIIADLESS